MNKIIQYDDLKLSCCNRMENTSIELKFPLVQPPIKSWNIARSKIVK